MSIIDFERYIKDIYDILNLDLVKQNKYFLKIATEIPKYIFENYILSPRSYVFEAIDYELEDIAVK